MEQTEFANPAHKVLKDAVAAGLFASRLESYVEESVKVGDTFYTRLLREKGREAALDALEDWQREGHRRVFSGQLEAIARAICILSSVDAESKLVKLLSPAETEAFAYWSNRHFTTPRRIVVFFNDEQQHRPRVCQSFTDWSRDGVMRLKAVALLVGENGTSVGLIFPSAGRTASENSHVFLEIDRLGGTRASLYEPRPISARRFLQVQMGLERFELADNLLYMSMPVADALGHPGALDYLAKSLPGFFDCLKSLAVELEERGWGKSGS